MKQKDLAGPWARHGPYIGFVDKNTNNGHYFQWRMNGVRVDDAGSF